MELHPDLANLDAVYRKLYEDVSNGTLTVDDAVIVLENTQVPDGDGALWSIDPHSGDFIRTIPGQDAGSVTDPAMFVGAVLPPIPFNGPERFTGIADGQPGAYSGPPSLAPVAPDSLVTRVKRKRKDRAPSSGAALGKVTGLLKGRVRSLIIPIVAVVVVLFMFMGGGSDEESTDVGVTPSTLPSPVTISVPGVPVVSTLPATTSSLPMDISVAPTKKNLDSIKQTLTSGKIAAVNKLTNNDVDVLRGILSLLGSKRAGFSLSIGECQPSEQDWVCPVLGVNDEGEEVSWDLHLRMYEDRWVISKTVLRGSEE